MIAQILVDLFAETAKNILLMTTKKCDQPHKYFMNNLITLGEVARKLNVPPHKILYLLATRKACEPSRIAGRRVWTQEQVQELAAALQGRSEYTISDTVQALKTAELQRERGGNHG